MINFGNCIEMKINIAFCNFLNSKHFCRRWMLMSSPAPKRPKVISNETIINTCYFQSLMFSADYSKANLFAIECNMKMDNSQLYGACGQTKNRTMLLTWIVAGQANANPKHLIHSLFDVLMATNAHHDANIMCPYLFLQSTKKINETVIECLFKRLDVFPIDNALRLFAEMVQTSKIAKFFAQAVALALQTICPYTVFNKVVYHGTMKMKRCNVLNDVIRFGHVDNLRKLLVLIPWVDLDVFGSHNEEAGGPLKEVHQWHNAETWVLQSKIAPNCVLITMIRAARTILEQYRTDRAVLVMQMLSNYILPCVICNMINMYGERPDNQITLG